MNKLNDAVTYVKERIPREELKLETYITTDNLKQNKGGKENAISLPPSGNTFPAYSKNDILIGNIRPYLRKIWFADSSGGHSADVLNLRVNKGICPRFIYYNCFQNEFFDHMMKGSKGSKMPRGDKNQILTFPIPDYSYNYQQQIAKVLSDLDTKIEVNIKINMELEAMAKLIYDYWFVQFDFPDKNGNPYKSSGGKMVYNKKLKCEIPEGWDVNTFADWIENDKNGDWGESRLTGNYTLKVNCIRGADMPSLDGFKTNESPLRYIHQNKKNKILLPNDLIVEISGGSPTQSTGRISYVTEETFERYEAPLICSNFCKSVTLKNPIYMYNFYYTWKEAWEQGNMFNFEGKTSGIRNLLFSSLVESFKVPVPDPNLVEKFHEFMKPIQAKKQSNLLENQKLAELRDWLLPMLMNGQVTVGEVKDKEQLGLGAEEGAAYNRDKEAIDSLFEVINFDYEVAAVQLLTERRFGFTYGKKYIHKMFSNIELLNTMPKLKELVFVEKGWGMFSKAIAKTIDAQCFVYQHQLDNGTKVLKVKSSAFKEVLDWTNQKENKGFVEQVNAMLDLYEKPLINKDMDRIELFNTVLECIKVLETDSLQSIRNKMAQWPMEEGGYRSKAEKFNENETFYMIGFIKENYQNAN